jgi:4-carboxymuconolactone decarboxylase
LASGDISIDEMREAVAHLAVYQGFAKATILHLAAEKAWARLQG